VQRCTTALPVNIQTEHGRNKTQVFFEKPNPVRFFGVSGFEFFYVKPARFFEAQPSGSVFLRFWVFKAKLVFVESTS